MRTALLALLLVLPAAADPLDDALARADMTRRDLGFDQRGYWLKFPRDIPGKLSFFDDLFAEPLAVVPFARCLGQAVREYLGPEGLAKPAERDAHSLYRAAQALGVDPRCGAFRGYSPNLTAPEVPVEEAVLALYRYAGRQTRFVTFGQESPYPLIEKELRERAKGLPPEISTVVGQLVLNVLDAHRWAELAFRRVPLETRMEAARRTDLAMETTDALEFCPAADDLLHDWDEASLWYAGLKCVEALDTARRKLAALPGPLDGEFRWKTPLGTVLVSGARSEERWVEDVFVAVDLGGDDSYFAPIADGRPDRPVSVALDMEGSDTYGGDSYASGLCGVGVLMNAGDDRDHYGGAGPACGAGQFGFGGLIDLGGNDHYEARWSSQGFGLFGIGLLLDAAGNDEYEIAADGQGFGAAGGVGVLADRCGDDWYFAQLDPAASRRPSYHSDLKVSVSNAQGCAMGRRGDGADGHSWAGGLGALLDVEGNDRYLAGNWCHGTGYWFGTGILWDGAGDDGYEGSVWSQATGAHFCIGALVDEGGNDSHVAKQSNSLAFGHDFTNCVLFDGGGDDRYETPAEGLGLSINRSFAFLIDSGGNDVYRAKNAPGTAKYDPKFAERGGMSTYWLDASSLGLFLDLGGKDDYGETDRNGTAWGDEPGSDNVKVRNRSVGVDAEAGPIDLSPLPGRRCEAVK